jgi:hypothetical protein
MRKAAIFIYISFLGKASAEIPPFPPLKKGGGGGVLEGHFKKLYSYRMLVGAGLKPAPTSGP